MKFGDVFHEQRELRHGGENCNQTRNVRLEAPHTLRIFVHHKGTYKTTPQNQNESQAVSKKVLGTKMNIREVFLSGHILP